MTKRLPHADVVGSLLRPDVLLEARERHLQGDLTDDALRAAEDRAIDAAVQLQEAAGLPIVTDGEYRRGVFYDQLLRAVRGFELVERGTLEEISLHWRGGVEASSRQAVQAVVAGKLQRQKSLAAGEFSYLQKKVQHALPKASLPAPSFLAQYWLPAISSSAYPTLEAYLADLASVLREEVRDLIALGATYIQFDGPNYGLITDPEYQRRHQQPLEKVLATWIEADNAAIAGFADVTFGLHVCRGNFRGNWAAQGGYDDIARQVFGGLRHERLLLEYDSERAGSFAPLAHLPQDKTAVLGIVSTKSSATETKDAVISRVREAARFAPLENLALSPQCGFASVAEGNPISWAAQRDKLRLVAAAAEELWG